MVTAAELPPEEPMVEDPATGLMVPPGFKAELIYKVDKKKYGSWISIAIDKNNRVVVSDQGKAGTFLIDLPKIGEAFEENRISKLPLASSQQGMLFAFDHLYMVHQGLLSRAPIKADGSFGEAEKLFPLHGGGEHGPHSLLVTEDGKGLYLVAGNFSRTPEFQKSRIKTNWKDDVLLENYAYGHNGNGKAPGGWVMKISPDGKEREIINMGYRNPVDFALNRDGEMFVYDADMEWDMGAPWYRPTRVNHGVSGGENGWRATSKKWRKYFPDTVGVVADVGPGCPTGVVAGMNAKFPTHYRDAIFLCDWTFATMYSLHLTPKGSSYTGELRQFVANSKGSLALTDVQIGADGHMYFTVGGRNGQSYLYRVYYAGDASTTLSKPDIRGVEERKTRHMLEAFHGKQDTEAVATAWPYLNNDDYHLRYAARIAIEWQDANGWAAKAYAEQNDLAAIHALLGLARADLAGSLQPTVERLNKVNLSKLDNAGKLALLRTYAVAMSRQGRPDADQAKAIGDKLDAMFPADDDHLNEELCRVLSYLQHPKVVEKTIALIQTTKTKAPDYNREIMKRNKGYGGSILRQMDAAPNVLNLHYLFCLKEVTEGWTMDHRKVYLGELKTLLSKSGGNMFRGYVSKIRESAIARVPEKDRVALQYLMGEVKSIDLAKLPKAKGPGVAWTVDSALTMLNKEPLSGRSLENGKKMFSAGLCVACHRSGNEGGGIGPDLTNLGKRSDYKSILESILHPNMVVSNQYEQHELKLKDGSMILGQVVTDTDTEYGVVTSGFEPLKVTKVAKSKVASKTASKLSMMPPGLINTMNAEELKDLMAYFVSGGNHRHAVYKKPKVPKKRAKPLNVQLISATYGVKGDAKKQMDVKSIIQKRLDARVYDFTISNDMVGKDPAPGVVKTLEMTYKIDGKTVTKTVGENREVSF
jgi:putative heme-binding domain-containing protein